ncbi:hypothetical protein, conserved [Plasmodium gonderi]|uniref:DUF4460 domain-containing protein n=1 Tax=Plasmodium gonderi TaxID=77519 RepID=A0A1Y1JKJ4_PLAGO|nr:hypothetical protein, conserved [Plasmodium gonderi]GAW82820.1 hypothetical protein, conserved [Plasmodium gonderi]
MLAKLMRSINTCNNFLRSKKYEFQFVKERKYESIIFRKSIRKLLLFFYKEIHPDLTQDLPEELKKVNGESLSVLNSYIDILSSSSRSENNIFIEKKLVFFKVFENSEHQIIKGRYKNIVIKLQTLSNNLSSQEKEQITAKLIYEIRKSLDKIKNVNIFNECDNESAENLGEDLLNYEKNGKNEKRQKSYINSLWDDLTNHVKNTQALFQPSEEHTLLMQKRRSYFYYIRKKLEEKYQKINHKKRRKRKLLKVKETANKITREKFPDIEHKNYENEILDCSYKIIQNGFDPNLIFFHKDIKTVEEKKKAIENICGMHLKDDADKWLLENCLKLLKNHRTQIPLVICMDKKISLSSTFGFIYIPLEFCVNDLFNFLENNLHLARSVRRKVITTRKMEYTERNK